MTLTLLWILYYLGFFAVGVALGVTFAIIFDAVKRQRRRNVHGLRLPE